MTCLRTLLLLALAASNIAPAQYSVPRPRLVVVIVIVRYHGYAAFFVKMCLLWLVGGYGY